MPSTRTSKNHLPSLISESSLKSMGSSNDNSSMTGSTQSVFEDMIKKMIMDMVQDDVSCSDSNNSVISDTVSNEDRCSQVKQNKALCKLRKVLKPQRRTRSSSKSKSSSKSSSKSKPKSKRDTKERRLSIQSLIDEVSKEFNLSDEFKVSLEDLNFEDPPPPEPESGAEGSTKEKSKRKSSTKMSHKPCRRLSCVKDLSIMSLVGEVSQEFDVDDPAPDDDDAAAAISSAEQQASSSTGARESKNREGKKKHKKNKKEKKKKKESSSDSTTSEEQKKRRRKARKTRRSRSKSITSAASTPSTKSSKRKMSSSAALKLQLEEVINDLNDLRSEKHQQEQQQQRHNSSSHHKPRSIPTDLYDHDEGSDSGGSVSTLGTMASTRSKPGSFQFNREMSSKLHCHRKSLCIQDKDCHKKSPQDNNTPTTTTTVVQSLVDDFVAAFDPNEMRCLALVSHNEMKTTMKEFVIQYKNVLKKFRLTGTNSTMTMLGQVFQGDESVVFGPACSSGPLGGDAELVAMMAQGQLGGILFFQDPMTSHPHQCDIECLVRQALVHNTVIATTPITAMTIMEVFKLGLRGQGRPELLPSFFFSLQSPTVESYKKGQQQVIQNRAS